MTSRCLSADDATRCGPEGPEGQVHRFGGCSIELLTHHGRWIGMGRCWIGDTQVRSGRLPLSPWTQSFAGHELEGLYHPKVDATDTRLRVDCEARFSPAKTKLMRDHSFDPIHDTHDWDAAGEADGVRTANLSLVVEVAKDEFNGVPASGFAYHWEYDGAAVPLFFLMDRASWELGGDIEGAWAIAQCSCSDPEVSFDRSTAWTTEGRIHWANDTPNPVMTHNLPRWASHQAFDFQAKDGRVLLGVFEKVALIRSVLRRDAGRPELKCFDKHLFDQSSGFRTTAKKILLADDVRDPTEVRNFWTWVMDEVHERARGEFGLREEPAIPRVSVNYWDNFTVDTYYRDLLPAAIDIGAKQVFIDNLNRSDLTEGATRHKAGNMCCGHEYEIAPALGGEAAVKTFVDRCREHGIQPMAWTNNDQSYASPLNRSERDERGWYVKMEDTRLKYGGAYTNVFAILDFARDEPRRYWVDSLKAIRERTGLSGYLFDSFYNLGFMPVSYENATPHTMWRQTLEAFKELQDADVHFLIESLGPFGQPQHGAPRSYNIDRAWVCYKIGLGNDYTTVPSGKRYDDPRADEGAAFFYLLAHMVVPPMLLMKNGKRIDERFGPLHREALRLYHEARPHMKRRYLQADGLGVLWHDAGGRRATLWNFEDHEVALPGEVRDVGSGETLDAGPTRCLRANRVYVVEAPELPTVVGQPMAGPIRDGEMGTPSGSSATQP